MQTKTAAAKTKKRIGRILVDSGIIQANQLEEALRRQKRKGGKLVESLIRLGHLDEQTLQDFLARQPGMPSIDLAEYKVDVKLCEMIPREFALKNEVFPVDKLGRLLTVGMSFPLDTATIAELEEMTGLHVKALLCGARDIKAAIREHYGEDLAEKSARREMRAKLVDMDARLKSMSRLLRGVNALPASPESVRRVQEVTSESDPQLEEIAAIVATDPGLSARMLQLSNASEAPDAGSIVEIEGAVELLGMEGTCGVVSTSCVVDAATASKILDHEAFWRESRYCTRIAGELARACGLDNTGAVSTAALLCDIGKLALARLAKARYTKIDEDLLGIERVAAEERILGIGHPEAGHVLAMHWGFPEALGEAIRFHHQPERAASANHVAALVCIAARMTELDAAGEAVDERGLQECAVSLEAIDLATDDALRVHAELAGAVT